MDAQLLENVELQFGVTLPSVYRKLLLNFPIELAPNEKRRFFKNVGEYELFSNAALIVEFNECVRECSSWGDEGPWPTYLFVIGHDGCGGYYTIDHTLECAPVFFWNHGTAAFESAYNSIDEFVQMLSAD